MIRSFICSQKTSTVIVIMSNTKSATHAHTEVLFLINAVESKTHSRNPREDDLHCELQFQIATLLDLKERSVEDWWARCCRNARRREWLHRGATQQFVNR